MLQDDKLIHFIGIGGIGVSAVARLALEKGFSVSGSDVRQSQLTEAMEALNRFLSMAGKKAAWRKEAEALLVKLKG